MCSMRPSAPSTGCIHWGQSYNETARTNAGGGATEDDEDDDDADEDDDDDDDDDADDDEDDDEKSQEWPAQVTGFLTIASSITPIASSCSTSLPCCFG